ncbi:pectin lyase fold/virulence factor [Plectosphaerella plurivora]|uniref:Pectin lyase fold/virulence factor n=1 Tax=Plectosphaerella plurivora TaxID=936078 RepID=A0A9P9AA28_9PEZI|nr:pectin lyase fold/virulence factor [Plectosphaerella plurivora]
MRLSAVLTSVLATLVVAAPVEQAHEIIKRQASESCTVGYCTQNGGTKGGAGGASVTVKTVAELETALKRKEPLVVIIDGKITGDAKVRVGTNDKTIIGAKGSSITGVGLQVRRVSNIIIRNLKIGQVLAKNGDAISIDESINVWVDHCDLSGDLSAGKDDLDGLLDISHGADFVTVSNTFFHDHWKGSLIGHSDNNAGEDTGKLHVTYANNHFKNVNSRQPLVRFGTVDIVNTLWENVGLNAVNTRMGAQVLVRSSALIGSSGKPAIFFADSKQTGYAVSEDVSLGGAVITAPKGTLTTASLPYKVTLLGSGNIAKTIPSAAGQKL